jgi:small-conductance mechanosensitive channel
MPTLAELVWAASYDPLVIVTGLGVVGVIVGQLLARRYPLARAIVRVVFLVLITIGFARAGIVPYQAQPSTGDPFLDLVHRLLKIVWWLWAAWFVVGLLRAFVTFERRPRESRLLQDLLAGVTYLTAAFAIAAYVLELPVQGLLATSGVLAIILGLALQSTLSDLFSGIVLDFSRPYLPGDWVNLEGTASGQVIEMNWRATHILTDRRDLAIIPNSTIAKSRITNVSSPSSVHGVTVTVQLDAGTQPSVGREAIEHAILNCRSIYETAAPTVTVKAITAGHIEFEVTFFVERLAQSTSTQNELFDMIYRHAVVAGIGFAPAPNQPLPLAPSAPRAKPGRNIEELLGLVAIFRSLTEQERSTLAARLKYASHEVGTMAQPREVTSSLFIIAEGVVSAIHEPDDIELGRLGPGDHYGEIGMLTGEGVPVRLDALVPVVTYELTKDDLAPILEARPEVAHELSRVLAIRVAGSRLAGSSEVDESVPNHQLGAWFFQRLHRLFNLAAAK